MRKAILGTMLGLMAATPANAERFAISCSGKSVNGFFSPGGGAPEASGAPVKLKDVIFVIDEEARTVQRYVPPKRRLYGVCEIKGLTCTASFSADRITMGGSAVIDGYRTTIGFDWDRKTGRVETAHDTTAGNGAGMAMRWSLKCVPAAIPAVEA